LFFFFRIGLETEEFEETLETFQDYNLSASHKVRANLFFTVAFLA